MSDPFGRDNPDNELFVWISKSVYFKGRGKRHKFYVIHAYDEYIGLCDDFMSLSFGAPTMDEALEGIIDCVRWAYAETCA